MRRPAAGLLSGSLGVVLAAGLTIVSPVASSASTGAPPSGDGPGKVAKSHELPNPKEEKRRALKQEALTKVINGELKATKRGSSTVVKLDDAETTSFTTKGNRKAEVTQQAQYVELAREDTDKIFVILAEFGNERHPAYPDVDSDPDVPGPVRFDGPLHNEIPKPNSAVDNATMWLPDFSQAYFQDLYFGSGGAPGSGGDVESVREWYERQSSGRYSVDGKVTAWTKVRYNEARYGRGGGEYPTCRGICRNTWELVRDGANQWYADQLAAGRPKAEVDAELKSFDEWDRYDFDADGNFNEPDGYIDHFQIVHAGGDEADGDPWQGEDAIWSHRWKTFQNSGEGPTGNADGGNQIGTSGVWIADYTIQPENGGMSVFAHEYGHDLGLPDLYDRFAPVGRENSVNWWSMMAQSRVSATGDQGNGTRGADFGAWEKLQLGWLDYEVVLPQDRKRLKLGPHEYQSKNAQAAVVVLPKKQVSTALHEPYAGSRTWFSGTGDDLDNTMSREVALPAGAAAQVSFQGAWNIEEGYDWAYVEVDDGTGWRSIPTSASNGPANGIEGLSEEWSEVTADLSAYAGQTVNLRLRYLTDGGVAGQDPSKVGGIFVDELAVTSGTTELVRSGAESTPEGWTLDGFSSVGATTDAVEFDNYYIASHRDYVSFDKYLQTGPYNFGDPAKPRWAEHFPYQDGLLVSYWDTSQLDNDVSVHPGEGLILPVDANPKPMANLTGGYWRARVAGYDAPFSLEKSDSLNLTLNGRKNYIRGAAAQPVFRDNAQFWFPQTPNQGVKVPNNGVNIKVLANKGSIMDIWVGKRTS